MIEREDIDRVTGKIEDKARAAKSALKAQPWYQRLWSGYKEEQSFWNVIAALALIVVVTSACVG